MLAPDEKQQIEESKTNPQCFEPLYVKYYEPILKFIYKRVESFDDTKEIVAIVFTKALINITKYKDQGFPFSSWLYRISINEINQFYRDTKKMRAISIDENGIQNLAAETDTEKREMISHLKAALNYLSEDEYMIIELRYFEERPFSEVGEILGITENNAKVKTYRIIEKLKGVFEKVS
ncbi:MAG: sigma-70 family RNA polymerase sigma factor [Bacteroidota bacterium]|nr:sigma-70 family RNA polymerase sigma factor [Bacteroidota bacterium]MDP3147100.1 sigma-70 family RNA polymerase sigma factor [Bacteroidota bacterium]